MRGGGLLSSTEGLTFTFFFIESLRERHGEREAQRAIQLEVTESPFVHATQDTSAPHSRRADLKALLRARAKHKIDPRF